jgi:uncharacterized protein (DUF433 family)
VIYSDRIVAGARVCGGQPVVKGSRIPVEIVLEQLALSPDLAELFADYPRLAVEDVRTCRGSWRCSQRAGALVGFGAGRDRAGALRCGRKAQRRSVPPARPAETSAAHDG